MTIVDAVRQFLASRDIPPGAVIVACSGGVDSTALLLAFAELRGSGFTPVAAHVNHHLRGEESEGDEHFVRELCERLGVPLHVADGSLVAAVVKSAGIEAAAREIREAKLHEIAVSVGTRWIATAHHQNDQAETVLMRLASGTGLRGLRAIHPVRDDGFIRPLLGCTRAGVEEFVASRGITPRFDSSNADPRFLRNRVRAALRDLGPDAIEGISRVAAEAAALWTFVDSHVDRAERAFVTSVAEDETRFSGLPEDAWIARALLARHLFRMGAGRNVSSASLGNVVTWIRDRKRISIARNVELARSGNGLVLRKRAVDAPGAFCAPISPGEGVMLPDGRTVRMKRASRGEPFANADHTRQVLAVPGGRDVTFQVRSRIPGDRVRLLGAPGSRKLKEVLIDRKISVAERDSLPILVCDGEIAWVAGVGVAERFKVTDDPALDLYEVSCE